MRRATYDMQFLVVDDVFVGINLGADFCAEHECGIAELWAIFGVGETRPKTLADNIKAVFSEPKPVFGIAKRTITKVPEYLFVREALQQQSDRRKKPLKRHLLMCDRWWFEHEKKDFPNELAIYNEEVGIAAGWDESTFGIAVAEEHAWRLQELYDAFKRLDMAIYLGASGPFANGGLKLVIVSRLPQAVLDEMYRKDESNYRLKKAAEATRIEEYLKSKGKKLFALSPRWANPEETEVRFWLNPCEQHIYDSGWFTVEELRQWANDTGPVLKK